MQETIVESVNLHCTKGGSDKVYDIQLAKVENNGALLGYVVRCQSGPRFGTMNTQDKITSPVAEDVARKMYVKVFNEKTNPRKGYVVIAGNAPGAAPVVAKAGAVRSPITKVKAGKRDLIDPQLLNPVDAKEAEFYLTSPLWCAQQKFDGDRIGLSRGFAGAVVGVSARSGLERGVPTVAVEALAAAEVMLLADGEQVGDVFHLFDLLEEGMTSLRARTLDERLAALAALHTRLPAHVFPPTYTARTEAEKRALLAELESRNAEGIVFKRLAATYTPGRPNSKGDWVKFKFYETATVEIAAINAQRSVAMCVYDSKGVKHSIGNVTVKPNQSIPAVGDVCEVKYLYFDKAALVQPELLGPRADMTAKDATLKQLKRKPTPHLAHAAPTPIALAA